MGRAKAVALVAVHHPAAQAVAQVLPLVVVHVHHIVLLVKVGTLLLRLLIHVDKIDKFKIVHK